MPIYEYRCSACQREFEYQHKMSDPDPVRCEACGQDKLERLISWTGVRSNSWHAGLRGEHMKESLKGTHIVDRSRSHRFTGNAPAATPPGDAAASAAPDAEAPAAADETKPTVDD